MHHPVYKEQSTAAADFPWSGRRECHLSIKREDGTAARSCSGSLEYRKIRLPGKRREWIPAEGAVKSGFSVKYKDLSAGPENGIDSVVETTGASSARAGCF